MQARFPPFLSPGEVVGRHGAATYSCTHRTIVLHRDTREVLLPPLSSPVKGVLWNFPLERSTRKLNSDKTADIRGSNSTAEHLHLRSAPSIVCT